MIGRRASLLSLALLASCVNGREPQKAAELVVANARIYTVDATRPWAEAFAVRDGRFVFVGSDPEAEAFIGPATRVVDAGGRLVLPGFHDAHVHALDAGCELDGCELSSAQSVDAIRARVAEYARSHPDAAWIVGTGWDQSLFPGGEPPPDFLGELEDGRPILLYAGDGGHTAWANAVALARAGVTSATPDPPNGRIGRDVASGAPNGVLHESAVGLVARSAPDRTPEEREAGLRRALGELARVGVVAFQEAAAGPETVAAYRALEEAGELSARVRLALLLPDESTPAEEERRLAWIRETRAALTGPRLTAGSVKLFLDGVIEGGTAALLEPYLAADGAPDAQRGTGIANYSPEHLARLVELLDAEGFQVHMHAIGDGAIRAGLDAIERARARNGARDARHHLAHVQLIDPVDIPRFHALGAAANVQALWAYADGYITELTEPVLGPARSRWIYPIRSLFESGAVVVGGSDWPVTSADPLAAIEVAVTRQAPESSSSPAWIPQERAELARMIEAYTLAGAWLEHAEDRSGSIEVGKLADFVLLDRDLFAIAPQEIGSARVLWTVLEGEELYRAGGW